MAGEKIVANPIGVEINLHDTREIVLANGTKVEISPTSQPWEFFEVTLDTPISNFAFPDEYNHYGQQIWHSYKVRHPRAYSNGHGLLHLSRNGTNKLYTRPAAFRDLVIGADSGFQNRVGRDNLPRVLGVDGFIVTRDMALVLAQRNEHVAMPHFYNGVAGLMSPDDINCIDPVAAPVDCLLREADEELGIKRSEVNMVHPLGMTSINGGTIRSIGHVIEVDITSQQLCQRSDKFTETVGIVMVPFSPSGLIQTARQYGTKMLGTTAGSLIYTARNMFGSSTEELVIRALTGMSH